MDYALDAAYRRAGRSPSDKRPYDGLGAFENLVNCLETISGGRWFGSSWRSTHVRQRHSEEAESSDMRWNRAEERRSDSQTHSWIANFCESCQIEYSEQKTATRPTRQSLDDYIREVEYELDEALKALDRWITASAALRVFRDTRESRDAWALLEAIAENTRQRERSRGP